MKDDPRTYYVGWVHKVYDGEVYVTGIDKVFAYSALDALVQWQAIEGVLDTHESYRHFNPRLKSYVYLGAMPPDDDFMRRYGVPEDEYLRRSPAEARSKRKEGT